MRELRYPIKYAIMPITGKIDGINNLYDYDIIANIVVKCYVISEQKRYLDDGTYKNIYEVVFKYRQMINDFEQVIPEYNYSECTNSTLVAQTFNSFEDALVVANHANEEIVNNKISVLACDENLEDNINKIEEKYQTLFDRYRIVQQTMEKETTNMEISKDYESNIIDIIDKIVENPMDFYISIARSLSIEERELIKQLITDKSCMNCTNETCMVATNEKSNTEACISWNNETLIGKRKILVKSR